MTMFARCLSQITKTIFLKIIAVDHTRCVVRATQRRWNSIATLTRTSTIIGSNQDVFKQQEQPNETVCLKNLQSSKVFSTRVLSMRMVRPVSTAMPPAVAPSLKIMWFNFFSWKNVETMTKSRWWWELVSIYVQTLRRRCCVRWCDDFKDYHGT